MLGWDGPCSKIQHPAKIECESVPERYGLHFPKASNQKLPQPLVAADCVWKLGHFGPLLEKLLRLRLSHSFAEAYVLWCIAPLWRVWIMTVLLQLSRSRNATDHLGPFLLDFSD